MTQIVLTEEQLKLLAQSGGSVEFCDSQGRHLGYLSHGFTNEDIELAQKSLASNEPRYTTAEVLRRLKSLESQ
jgi:CRISPR/Cas system-associated endonuclease Cas1